MFLPAERQISSRNHLYEIHKIEGFLGRLLVCVVQRIDVMGRPSRLMLSLHICNGNIAKSRAKAEVVDLVREGVRIIIVEIHVQVVHVQVAIGEGLSRSNVEVANDLVDLDIALDTASFFSLCVELFAIVFALTLLDPFATTERPGVCSVSVTDIFASLTATWLRTILWGWGAVAFTAVVRIKM